MLDERLEKQPKNSKKTVKTKEIVILDKNIQNLTFFPLNPFEFLRNF